MSFRRRLAINRWTWIAYCLAGGAGCSTISAPHVPSFWSTSDNVPTVVRREDDEFVRRASYVNEKYKGDEILKEKSKDESFLDQFSVEAIGGAVKKATGNGPDPTVARQHFAEAEVLYLRATQGKGDERQAAFQVAGEKYQAAAERWPGSVLAEDSWFMAGESFFFADNYPAARDMYDGLTKNFPNSRHLDVLDAHRFAIAQYWLTLDKKDPQPWYEINLFDRTRPWRDTSGHAFKVFDHIRLDDPTGKLADDATMAAANEKFLAGDFIAADDLYTDLRKSFPSSEHQFDAHFLGLKTKLECYVGPDYDDQPLDQAEQLIKQIRKQFPHKAAEQKEFLDRSYAEVRFRKAERLFMLGRFYELQTAYGASSQQYQRVIDEYSDTPFAKQAQERIAENAGKPPEPPKYFDSIVELFPKRQIAKPLIPNDDPSNGGAKKR